MAIYPQLRENGWKILSFDHLKKMFHFLPNFAMCLTGLILLLTRCEKKKSNKKSNNLLYYVVYQKKNVRKNTFKSVFPIKWQKRPTNAVVVATLKLKVIASNHFRWRRYGFLEILFFLPLSVKSMVLEFIWIYHFIFVSQLN